MDDAPRGSERQRDDSSRVDPLGGIVHTYLGYDPKSFPPPRSAPPDFASAAFEHLLTHGSLRRLTAEELANAVEIDPSQIRGLGPSLESLIAMLEERKRRILETYETETVRRRAKESFRSLAAEMQPPPKLAERFRREVEAEQLRDLERLWYDADERSPFATKLVHLVERLGEKYRVDALAAKYAFTGRTALTVEEALKLKEELETIDRLLEQLREAMKNARVALIDFDALERFAPEEDVANLRRLEEQVREMIRELAEAQGVERSPQGWSLTPKALRTYQSKLLREIFDDLQAARSGRHEGVAAPEGAIELAATRPWQFGDSLAALDSAETITNALLRRALDDTRAASDDARENSSRSADARAHGARDRPLRLHPDDLRVHRTKHAPRCATAVIIDMSGSMRYGGQYVSCKRMAIALDGLIRREYPGDSLFFVEMYTLARAVRGGDLAALMPRRVSVSSPVVRLRADMSDPKIGESDLPLHFTNIQRALQIARQLLAAQATPNRQIMLLTDGLPTAHFEGADLYMLYPPSKRTESATMREAQRCRHDGITLNVMLLPSWAQDEDDVSFAHRMAESTGGRVFFTGGRELDRFVVWDYVKRRRSIIG